MTCPWGRSNALGIDSFCEQVRTCAWVLQPANAASAVAFLIVTVAFLWQAHKSGMRILLALAACSGLLALGTAAQHITGTRWGMLLDYTGMQSMNVLMACVGLRRWQGGSWRTLAAIGVLIWVVLILLTAMFDSVRRTVMVAGMVPCAALELRLWFRDGTRTNYRWFFIGWLLFVVAVVAWIVDSKGWVCAPQSVLQLHALWHVSTAAALLAWGAYYRQFRGLQPRRQWRQT